MVNHILTVRGRKASVTPRALVQGTVGQDTLTLDLDSEWNGLNVTVTFVAATTEVTPVLNANTCEIPHEVLVDSGEIDVFVLGTRDGKAMRHASLVHKMVVKKSNMSDGSTTADPSISAYRQAYDDAVKATEAANSAAGAAGSTAVEMAKLNNRYETQISQQATSFSTDQIQRADDFSTAQTQRANDFSTAQTQRAHDFDSAMQGYENAFNEAEGERAAAETERVKVENERVKAEEKRAQDSKTRLEELAQAKINAETATGEANTARDEAKKAATDATSAAGNATDAAGLAETAKTNANTAAEEANAAATKAEAAARKADGAADTAGTAAITAAVAANKADTAAGNAESMAEKADASANKADIAAGKANEATIAATNAATKANEVEAKLTGSILKGKVKETFVHVDDAFPSSLLGIEVEGACKQDGTPSPDNPVPIEVIENPIIHICGKNLLKVDDSSATARGVTTSSKDGVITLSGVATENGYSGSIAGVYLPNGAIGQKLSVKIYEISGTVPQVNLLNKRYGLLLSSTQSSTVLNEQIAYLTVNVIKGVTYDCKFYVSVEVYGDADSGKYSPFNETSTSFTLPSEHPYLAKLPDGTADEIVVDREGNVELVARMTRNTLTSWAGTAAGYFTCAISPSRANNSVLCTGGVKLTGQVEQGDVFVGAALGIVGYQPREGDTTDALNAKGLLLYYKLVTPNRYPLGKIEMPKAQDSIVNAWTDAEVTPRTGIEYTRDVNIVVANLESAIASITQG
nr:MAG TPA: hypothetical protein [Caudoviricetes sp.]